MQVKQKAKLSELLREKAFQHSFPLILVAGLALSFAANFFKWLPVIVDNKVNLAITGVAVAAFLFTAQSILVALSSNNPYMRAIRREGHYLAHIHRCCRRAEVMFVGLLIPMLYMSNGAWLLNVIVFAGYIAALLFTIWSMILIGEILIICEQHPE